MRFTPEEITLLRLATESLAFQCRRTAKLRRTSKADRAFNLLVAERAAELAEAIAFDMAHQADQAELEAMASPRSRS